MHIFGNVTILNKQENPYNDRNEGSEGERFYHCLAEISSGVVDTDGHIMGDSTLQNFARDASIGKQVKDSHEYMNGFGKTFDGVYEESGGEGGVPRTLSGLRISRSMPLDGKSYSVSDGFIQAIQDEVITNVSIGAYGGYFVCNICGSIIDRTSVNDCFHWPLCEYEVADEDGNKQMKVCYWTYHDGRLREVSLVDCGACPGAGILEARLEDQLSKGLISDEHLYVVKGMYKFMDRTGYSFGGMDPVDAPYVGDPSKSPGTSSGDGSVDDKVDGSDNSVDDNSVDIEKNVEGALMSMTLEQATQEISRLDTENANLKKQVDTLTKDVSAKEARISELSEIEKELKSEKDVIIAEILPIWKENRGSNFTGDELTRYEKRVGSMDLWNLKEEKNQLEGINRMLFPEKYVSPDDDGGEGDEGAQGAEGADDVNKSDSGDKGKEGSSGRKTVDDPKKGLSDDDLAVNRPPEPNNPYVRSGLI